MKNFDSVEKELVESKEKIEEKEETFELAPETGIELKHEEPEELAFKDVSEAVASKEDKENKESLEEVHYSSDRGASLGNGNAGLFDYLCLVVGLGVLGFLAYLLLKG